MAAAQSNCYEPNQQYKNPPGISFLMFLTFVKGCLGYSSMGKYRIPANKCGGTAVAGELGWIIKWNEEALLMQQLVALIKESPPLGSDEDCKKLIEIIVEQAEKRLGKRWVDAPVALIEGNSATFSDK